MIKDENAQLKNVIESFQKNDFLMERHAREDFGLAKPDEYIFIYDER
jgi:cell division protein FtsB